MLERLAAWFLNTYVADYVGNVVTDQLSIGLLKGAVELEKLPLKRDALRKLKLPVDIKSGYIGKLKLQIPVRYIKSQPWVVQIDQLYLVAGPTEAAAYNEEEEKEREQAAKRAKLAKLEEEWKAEQQKGKGWWWSPLSAISLPSNVIANLQIIVNDVHIRYEDRDAVPGHPFTVGALLENISAQSTNQHWEPQFVSGEEKAFKLVDLKNFTVYSDSELFGELEGQDLVDAMLQKHGSVLTQQEPMTASTLLGATPTSECLIKPVSGQAKLTRNCSKDPLKISDGPRFHLDVQLDDIPVLLTDTQYESLLRVFESFSLRVRARKFQRRRPLVPVAGNGMEWWRFAIETTLEKIQERNKTRSKEFVLERARQNVVYVTAYMQHLTQEALSEETKEEMDVIEAEQSYEQLVVLRKVAMATVKREMGLAEAVRMKLQSETTNEGGILQRWFPGWVQRPPPTANQDPTTSEGEPGEETTLSEEDELMNELGYESNDSMFLRDRIFLTLSFSLSGGSFQLLSTPSSIDSSFLGPELLLELGFSSLCCSVDLRPRLRYATLDLSLGSLSVQDHTDSESLFPVLVQPKGERVNSERVPLFQRQYTVFDPLDTSTSSSALFELNLRAEEHNHCKHFQLHVQSKPLDIVYNPATVTRVKQFLYVGGRGTVDKLSQQIQYQTAEGIKSKIEDILEGDSKSDSRSVVSVKMDLSAPHIILPEDFNNENSSLVVLDLGHVTFGNVSDWSTDELGMNIEPPLGEDDDEEDDDDLFQTPLSSPPSAEEETTDGGPTYQPHPPDHLPHASQSDLSMRRQQMDPYERYLLRLSDLQVLVGTAGEKWKEAIRAGHSDMHLLDKFTLSFQIQRVVRPVPGCLTPTTSLAASLPSLRFHINEEKVQTVISCLRAMSTSQPIIHSGSSTPLPSPTHLSASIYQSVYSADDIPDHPPSPSVQASMYHSALGDSFLEEREESPHVSFSDDYDAEGLRSDSRGGGAKERKKRKSWMSRERQFCAQFAINEALLSISSRGRLITELRVPGIKFGCVKRPHDIGLQVQVQDLFLVDRIQSFGPGYELVICSSGSTLLDYSISPEPTNSIKEESSPSQANTLLSPQTPSSGNFEVDEPKDVDYSVFSNDGLPIELFSTSLDNSDHALLVLSYSLLTPDSPQHPAVRDRDEEDATTLGDEPNIHRVDLECTAVDAIANQEVVMELISFFQRALPEELFTGGAAREESTSSEEIDTQLNQVPSKPLHTELNIKFERLGIRFLRKLASSEPCNRLISEIMLYGLAIEGTVSTDVLIQGELEGICATDLTPTGRKYSNILLMGTGSGPKCEATPSKQATDPVKNSLSFSITRSPRPVGSLQLSGQLSDIHLNVNVPTIQYTHSVNFVYEMEIFVSEFKSYATIVKDSFKTAAVGVAKGLVSKESQLARGLSKLHLSFGQSLTHHQHSFSSADLSDDEGDIEDQPTQAKDRIYFNFSVQSPVIVIPSSLKRDDCLIAHLGEITVNNEFITQRDPSTTQDALSSSTVDRLTISITRVSLHATRGEESRRELLWGGVAKSPLGNTANKCFEVLKKTSATLQVDRRLEKSSTDAQNGGENHELVVSGKICEDLLVKLPKEVFDQIQYTLKHSIRKKPPQSKLPPNKQSFTSMGSVTTSISNGTVNGGDTLPSIFASFSLPKLSLELKHTLEGKAKDLVYMSFDGFAVQVSKLEPYIMSCDLSLKSIIIEDWLQPKHSEYRYILASSMKPLPMISPVPTPSKSLSTLSVTPTFQSFSRHYFPLSQLMSTPKPPVRLIPSPMRSFNPHSEESPGGQDETKSTEHGDEESRSTLIDDSTKEEDLLSIKALYVDKKCPSFASDYNSESVHASVDFNSVYVIINLQTWVVLFDYLGIGIPTPPPSPSSTPEPLDPEPSTTTLNDAIMTGSTHVPSVDHSLLEDALEFTSLGSDPASSLYRSAWQSLPSTSIPEPPEERSLSPPTLQPDEGAQDGKSVWGVEGKMCMGIELSVKSLTVTFNKLEHPLARGNISHVTAQLKMNKGNTEIKGMLGQASVTDLTETGAYYRERFTTTGEQALTFDIFKYGRPDPFMERPFDITIKVVMSSVRYLHTNRFLKEVVSFLSHFPQLIDAFQRMKAMAEGNLVYHGPERKGRMSYDVEISGPLLLIPKHAFAPELIVGDIGHIRVTNSIRYDGEEGTISRMRREQGLDEIQSITGTEYGPPRNSSIPLYTLSPQASAQSVFSTVSDSSVTSTPSELSSLRTSSKTDSIFSNAPLLASQRGKLDQDNTIFGSFQSSVTLTVEEDRQRIEKQLEAFKGPCLLDCIVVELSDVDVFSARKVKVSGGSKIVRQPGNVLKEKGAAKLFIERNLYEDFCRDVPDFHVEGKLEAIHVLLDKPQLELIKGLVEMNLGEAIEEFEKPSTVIHDPIAQPIAKDVWTGFLFRMQFVGVQFELLQSRQSQHLPGSLTRSLARFDIQESEFSFEARSNQCQTVDLTSRSVIGYDTRYEDYAPDSKPSVFEEVLRPRFGSSANDGTKKAIQVEIHVSLSPKQIKASILLNKLRLIGIFDLILELKKFMFDKLPEEDENDSFDEIDAPYQLSPNNSLLQQRLASYKDLPGRREVNKPPRDVHVKLSMTETDFVVVEDTRQLRSNAVVLKSTLILKFRSSETNEKTINCSIDGLELFSCALCNEDETALSILDPVSVSVDVRSPSSPPTKAVLDEGVTGSAQVLEVEIQQLNFRLSYNDIKLFLAIAQSLPPMGSTEVRENPLKRAEQKVDENLVKRLLPLGFTKSSIRKELYLHDSDPNAAALKLLSQQEESVTSSGGWESHDSMDGLDEGGTKEKEKENNSKPFTIRTIQVQVGTISVCLIDDSVNRDVPLMDFSLQNFQAEHHLMSASKGCARGVFAGDYYNRGISAWEPVIEQWMLQVNWQVMKKYSTDLDSNDRPDRMCLTISSDERLCLNVTSSLIQILKATQASWRQDIEKQTGGNYSTSTSGQKKGSELVSQWSSDDSKPVSNMEKGLALLHSVRFVSQTRQRTLFVPFLLRNSTGLPLKFATLTSVPSKVYVGPSALYEKARGRSVSDVSGRQRSVSSVSGELSRTSDWMEVAVGGEKPFNFTSKGKIRHRDTRELVVHQLLVKVAGWQCIQIPVSVDKIGVIFREVWPSTDSDLDDHTDLPSNRDPVRLVFAISLSDTQKVVNIRSALVLVNTMELPLEVKLEPPKEDRQSFTQAITRTLPPLQPKGYAAVPLHLTSQNIRVRPQGWGVQYCIKPIAWKQAQGKQPTSHARECEAIGEGGEPPFRFCVSVQRENFPTDPSPQSPQPAHTITLYSPLTIANLLPCDMQFSIPRNGKRKIVRRGKEIAEYSVDSIKAVEFQVELEGFVPRQSCVVSMDKVGLLQGMILEDSERRPLKLSVMVEILGGTALKVSVFCAYWLINRTGLPLVFKQDGMSSVAAAQHEENEKASTTTPLLFSYSDGDLIEACTMRLGNNYRYLNGGRPVWCNPFRMVSGSGVMRVFVKNKGGRPDSEYQIGVDIQKGRRQYQGTRVVTLVARYQLENKTQYKIVYLQRHQLQKEEKLVESKKIPLIIPSAIVSFHWPRIDFDQLLCIRVEDISDCQWSGGFSLDKDSSFHILMRGRFGHSIFIRCEITLIGATYHIVFSDAAQYPPPFRLENLSQMSMLYRQNRTHNFYTLNPGQSIPYAWDETTLPEVMCLQVKGADEFKEFDFNTFGTRGKLYYESYFYVSAMSTFAEGRGEPQSPHSPYQRRVGEEKELVLDVPQGTAVIFQRKDPNKRTQLWRMSASRQLVHIASEPSMVLDIAGGRLPGRGQTVPLVIKRASSSRQQSQSWRFTEDDRLLLEGTPYLCVQSKPGHESLREGVDAVLGHLAGGAGPVPPEHTLRRMKHSPGSGVLSVSVVSDGPTRLLRVTDVNRKYTHTSPPDDWVIVEHGLVAPAKSSDVDSCQDNSWDSEEEDGPSLEIELSLLLEKGIGVSLINQVPEELIFASLAGIRVDFISSSIHQCLNATVQKIQVDNNLAGSHTPVLAYSTPPSSGEPENTYPVLKVVAEKIPQKSPFAQVFKLLEVKVGDITLHLEEKLLFKLLQWAGVGQVKEEEEAKEEHMMTLLTQHRLSPQSSSKFGAVQIYFEHIRISEIELTVSMLTTSQLPEDLLKIKRHLGVRLAKFESPIYLDGYHQAHTLGDTGVHADSLKKHYKGVVLSQAVKILGSVDFLGNPVGLLTDVASGVSGLASSADVVGLVRDVTHGMSDTTSKLTGTVSHMVGQVTLDSSYQEEREQIRESAQSSTDHFKAGLMGLSSGVFGGVTSIFTQPYKGAQEYGVGGFIAGIGKGVIGTVAKPVAGLFDLASGATAAIRETTSRVSRHQIAPVRLTRNCLGSSGALTPYSNSQARGQEYLMRLTDGEVSEKLVSYELLYNGPSNRKERMKVIISSQFLYFFTDSPPDPKTIDSKIPLDDLAECRPAMGKSSIPTVYIILSLMDKESSYRAPKYKCTDEKTAIKVAQLINYAKNLHEEEKHIVRTLRLQCETIW